MGNITHSYVSPLPQSADPTVVSKNYWNEAHVIDETGILVGSSSNSIVGVSTANKGSFLQAARNAAANVYQFTRLTPVMAIEFKFTIPGVANLTAGVSAIITPAVMPDGITADSVSKHYVRIVDAIGGNETVLITARTATTFTFTPTLSHSAADYTIVSASDGIQEAIKWAELQPDGAGIHLDYGFMYVYQTIWLKGVPAVGIFGAGKQATTVVGMFAAGDIFYCENSSQLIGFFEFSIGPGVTHTSGAVFHLKDNTGGYPVLQNIRVVQAFIGIWIDNSDFVTLLNCDVNGDPNPNAQDLVLMSGSPGDITIIGGIFMCAEINDPNMTDYGIRITGLDGLTVYGAHIRANIGVGIFPPAGGQIGTALFEGCIIDKCREQNIAIGTIPLNPPALLSNVQFVNCHILGGNIMQDVDMIVVDTTSMGTVRFGLSFVACVIANGNKNNMSVTGVNTLTLVGNAIANSNWLSSTGVGASIINCTALTICGNSFEDTRTPALQQYGLVLGGAINLMAFSGNVFKNNLLDPINNLATITNSTQGINAGLTTERPTIASASTISVASLRSSYLITGTTTINTINGSVGSGDIRYLFCPSGLTFGLAGNIANTLTTSAAGQVVTIIWDAIDSKWRIR